jgi:3-oxoacyl-[acyl-carrier protein] reductase
MAVPHPPLALHGSVIGAGGARNCVAPGLLEGTRATSNLRPEQIERSASGSLLKKAVDKDDCADMVVAMCRTETMTGQTVVIDSGRLFH